MDLIINGKNMGAVTGYRQNRGQERWVFLMKAGYYISVDWDNIKIFDSCGVLEIVTYDY